MKLLAFVLLSLSLAAHAAPGPVHCESENVDFTFNMASTQEIADFDFNFKAVPGTTAKIQSPKSLGGGIFDVGADGKERYIEIPPYAARSDVNQFIVEFQAYAADDKGLDFAEDVYCKN